jgi:hypothetical protein
MNSFAKLVVALLSSLTLATAQAQTVADISHGITDKLIDANVEILLSDAGEPDDPSSHRNRAVVLYKPTGASHAYAIMLLHPPTGDFNGSWISSRYTGTAQAIRHKDLALIHVGGPRSDPHMQLAIRAFLSGVTGPDRHSVAPEGEEAITRYRYLSWLLSAPDQMLTGAFVLSFMSEDKRAIERVGTRLAQEGLPVEWGRFKTNEGEFYFCRTMLREQWGPTKLTRSVADLRPAWDTERTVSFLGWTPAEVDSAVQPTFPRDDVVFSKNLPW